jgi:hypothetical protein
MADSEPENPISNEEVALISKPDPDRVTDNAPVKTELLRTRMEALLNVKILEAVPRLRETEVAATNREVGDKSPRDPLAKRDEEDCQTVPLKAVEPAREFNVDGYCEEPIIIKVTEALPVEA